MVERVGDVGDRVLSLADKPSDQEVPVTINPIGFADLGADEFWTMGFVPIISH